MMGLDEIKAANDEAVTKAEAAARIASGECSEREFDVQGLREDVCMLSSVLEAIANGSERPQEYAQVALLILSQRHGAVSDEEIAALFGVPKDDAAVN